MSINKWTKKQLNILYECWKNADTNKERLILIEKMLPQIPPLVALNKMRMMVKSNSKWISMATRKKNQEIKEKLAIELEKQKKRNEKEKRKKEKEKKKKEREKKRKCLEEIRNEKKLKEKIKSLLLLSDEEKIKDKVNYQFFFCPKIHQFINEVSCIFRIFSNEYELFNNLCEKCTKMDKYIPILQEVVKNGRQERVRSNKASERGSKTKKKKKIKSRKSKNTTIKSNTGCGESPKSRRNTNTK